MNQLWTIIFVAVVAAAYGLACWHDREDRKARERGDAPARGRGDGAE